jgi:aminoglycoside/choline kinase family phosphotransferase
MHRDFQSENIMIHEDKPWFIDFQGAHWGPSVFDLVSFLKDPYVNYPDDLRERLKTYYFSEFSKRTNESQESLERAYILCGLQRHMQALGAYGFISTIRGKESFASHCRSAFDLLSAEVLLVQDEFPALYRLLSELEGRF